MELVHQQWLVQILFKSSGVQNENVIMLDRKGVIYKGRPNVDQFKSAHAIRN